MDFGKASFLDKARQQPEKVKMVLEKIQTDGLLTTIEAVQSKLRQPLLLGYCNVGVVSALGPGVEDFAVGDRVLSNGPHADVVRVPKNLCAKIPGNVSDSTASFAVVASIGLQGIRLANPTLGECVVVIGVGLIGLLTVQLLRAQGCRVLAIDYDQSKLELAKKFGAEICNPCTGEDPVAAGNAFSRGVGVDAVLVTAATKSSDPVTQAARMSRKRGRIVMVGVTGLELNRADFYEKELSFQVSCSYGPGRYDTNYEDKGLDYPLAFVRWTEQRNFEAVLDMMSSGAINVDLLITHKFLFEEAPKAYEVLTNERSALGILLEYSHDISQRHNHFTPLVATQNALTPTEKPSFGFIGAGNYASRILIPAFKNAGAELHTISTSGGINGVIHGKKSAFLHATTDTESLINNNEVDALAIVTQHNTHANFVTKALKAGKHVFVEKPLALSHAEIEEVERAYSETGGKQLLMVGFNRRFSPHVQKIKSLLSSVNEPKSFILTMNAGAIPADNWIQQLEIGGGRIIGEACHYIDLMRYLADSEIVSIQAIRMGNNDAHQITEDKASITLGFADGSHGTIHYFANGPQSFPKERVEVFAAGRALQLDNFRKLKGYGWPGFNKMNLWRQDKGQVECCKRFIDAIEQGGTAPISPQEIFEVAKATIDAANQLRSQQ
ncbi:bi-domain-containing oxidoreductase [Oceaniserpentilla sp. 4NH20-0058]